MTLTPQLAQQCLEALEILIDYEREEYQTNWRLRLPSRAVQFAAMKDLLDHHEVTITALREALASGEGDEARDAARYRWLRNESDFLRLKSGSPQVCMTNEWGEIVSLLPSAYPRGETLDATIDAAMKGSGK